MEWASALGSAADDAADIEIRISSLEYNMERWLEAMGRCPNKNAPGCVRRLLELEGLVARDSRALARIAVSLEKVER